QRRSEVDDRVLARDRCVLDPDIGIGGATEHRRSGGGQGLGRVDAVAGDEQEQPLGRRDLAIAVGPLGRRVVGLDGLAEQGASGPTTLTAADGITCWSSSAARVASTAAARPRALAASTAEPSSSMWSASPCLAAALPSAAL